MQRLVIRMGKGKVTVGVLYAALSMLTSTSAFKDKVCFRF